MRYIELAWHYQPKDFFLMPVDEANLFLKNKDLLTIPPATPTTPVVPSTSLNPLYCRVCRADMCDDITVSMTLQS